MGRLSDEAVRNAEPRGKPWKLWYGEHGLYWMIQPNGKKLARAKVYIDGRERTLSLGPHPTISVAKAVKLVLDRRAEVCEGLDPIAAARERRERNHAERRNLFGDGAQRWYRSKVNGWSPTHARDVRRILKELGPLDAKPRSAIHKSHVQAILDTITDRASYTFARDVKLYFGTVWRFLNAEASHDRQLTDPSKAIVLPDGPKERHHARLTEPEIGPMLRKVSIVAAIPLVRIAFLVLLLCGLRYGELRFARWSEIDVKNRLWRIPATRTKQAREHLVPLSTQALALIEDLRAITGTGELMFASPVDPTQPISDGTILALIRRMGLAGQLTGHGLRGMLSSWANERDFKPDAVERQLGHDEKNKVRGAYNSAQYMPERKRLLQEWADWLDQAEREARKVTLRSVA